MGRFHPIAQVLYESMFFFGMLQFLNKNIFSRFFSSKGDLMQKFKTALWLVTLMIGGWVGFNTYQYFFNINIPESFVSGVKEDGYYAGDISCVVNGSHHYKVGKISVFLDGTPLIYNFSIGKQSFEHPFAINTRTLTNGKHSLQTKVVDGTFKKNECAQTYNFHVDNTPLQAAFVRQNQESRVFQGRTLHVQFQVNKPLKEAKVHAFTKEYDCFPESENSLIYEAYIPVECEEKANEYLMTVDCMDPVDNVVALEGKVQVVAFPFKKQKLHVSAEKIKEEKEMGVSQQLLEDKLSEVIKNSPKKKLWHGAFYTPCEIQWIATEYGVIRTTNEKGKYAHKAIDIANTPKSVVWAPEDGVVVVKERYGYSGNTVVLDHGHGLTSLFFHLDSFPEELEVGQVLKKGKPLGTLGKTGYASGYHLHWEMRINNVAVDPMQWTKELLA
jgi:hypothetical protein